ncbi:MAG TPA: PP2C family protein-serine/threonine phosphatase [Actinocrinis sp.]|nr:PP2C family protein-serine/threonine phosphatase [Actinocrinis sp.]
MSSYFSRETPQPGPPSRLVRAMPFALILAVVLGDLATPRDLTFSSTLSVAPALAAIGTRRMVWPVAVGLLSALAVVALAWYNHNVPVGVEVAAVTAVLAVTLLSWVGVRATRRQDRVLADLRTVAETAQRVLLREVPPNLASVRASVRYVAAAAEARIGGDLYEAVATRYGDRLIIGDVRGKGLPAVEAAADVLGIFREAVHQEPDLGAVAIRLHEGMKRRERPGWTPQHPEPARGAVGAVARVKASKRLRASRRRRRLGQPAGATNQRTAPAGPPKEPNRPDEDFVTAVLMSVPPDRMQVELVNCGHPPPLLVHAGKVVPLDPAESGPPLGLLDLVDGMLPVYTASFEPGDAILLYTDGTTEARDAQGDFYPLVDDLAWATYEDPDALVDHVLSGLLLHSGPRMSDDVALMAVQRLPEPTPEPEPESPVGGDPGATGPRGQVDPAQWPEPPDWPG